MEKNFLLKGIQNYRNLDEYDIFDCSFYEQSNNDCFWFNELCLNVDVDQHIDVNDWNNDYFEKFIINIIKKNDTKFDFKIEQKEKCEWIYVAEKNIIRVEIWGFPGHLYEYGYINVNDVIIKKLDDLKNNIRKFKNKI